MLPQDVMGSVIATAGQVGNLGVAARQKRAQGPPPSGDHQHSGAGIEEYRQSRWYQERYAYAEPLLERLKAIEDTR